MGAVATAGGNTVGLKAADTLMQAVAARTLDKHLQDARRPRRARANRNLTQLTGIGALQKTPLPVHRNCAGEVRERG